MASRRILMGAALAGLSLGAARAANAQAAAEPLAVGTAAPEFTLVGATADGVLADSLSLTDFRGHTLIIAFFFRARSSG